MCGKEKVITSLRHGHIIQLWGYIPGSPPLVQNLTPCTKAFVMSVSTLIV